MSTVKVIEWTGHLPERASDATLRDYFAAAALSGYRANHPGIGADIIAKECYKDADAMLAERARKEAQP